MLENKDPEWGIHFIIILRPVETYPDLAVSLNLVDRRRNLS